jgi:hypothetical protein
MCLEDVMKQRHSPKKRAGCIRQLLGLYLRELRVALEIRRLTSRWIGPHLQCASRGMLGEFGVIVVCSARAEGWAERGPGRSPQRTWDCAARGR